MAANNLNSNQFLATKHVLSIPELLTEMFLYSYPWDNASNLFVNKTWAEEVLSVEWRKVSNQTLGSLLGLLAPMEQDDMTYQLAYARSLEAADWERFDRYAFRVRILVGDWYIFRESVFATIAQSQPRTKLLPNLERLTCPIDLSHLKTFAHSNVASLTLCDPDEYDEPPSLDVFAEVFSFIQETLPTLQHLEFNLSSDQSRGYIYVDPLLDPFSAR